eukprot:8741909-Alexandrium_andersonii.AAC.1
MAVEGERRAPSGRRSSGPHAHGAAVAPGRKEPTSGLRRASGRSCEGLVAPSFGHEPQELSAQRFGR